MSKNEDKFKVQKQIDTDVRIMNLRLPYLGIFVIFFVIGLLVLLGGKNFMSFVFTLFFWAIGYVFSQYSDGKNLLDAIYVEKLPKELNNDLYKRHGNNKS